MVYINFELVMVGAISKSGFVTSTNKISERSQADRLLWLKECVAEYESHIVLLNKIVGIDKEIIVNLAALQKIHKEMFSDLKKLQKLI